jgi:NAD(P)-dependent dehydrogenase (short-subunit alcohol dehydrogenase family)
VAIETLTRAVPDVSELPIARLLSLEGRRAVVTGGAKGIGYAIAKRFAEAGAQVVIGDVKEAQSAAADLAASFAGRVHGVVADVTQAESVKALAEHAYTRFGGLEIWVNNAGIYPPMPVLNMTEADWDRVLDINLRGTFIGAREAARKMIEGGRGGVIVNLSSTAGFRAGGPGVAHYVASKHAIRGLTKSLAVEFGPYGIRVLALAPTLIDTPGISELRKVAAAVAPGTNDMLEVLARRLPLGRAGVPDDIARVALFCASDMSMLMTGSTLAVDAGDLAL